MQNVGERIKQLRKEAGMTQGELATAIGTTKQNISRYESTDRTPRVEMLLKIANALEVPIEKLITDISALPNKELQKYIDLQPDRDFTGVIAFLDDELKEYLNQLNADGKAEALRLIKLLSKIPEFKAV